MEKKENSGALLKNALIISVSGFIAKIIGAFYRLPLTNILGSYGMGIYQMVFPFYSMLLTLSATGIPSALSKLISATEDADKRRKILTAALLIIPLCGLLLSAALALLSGPAAKLQGNAEAGFSYLMISPAVFFVSILAVFRGFFQGRLKMVPSAASQIIEQLVKVTAGLIICKSLMPDIRLAAAGCCLAVTISEAVAVLFMIIIYKAGRKPVFVKLSKDELQGYTKSILRIALPMILISVLPPLTNLISSFYAINIIKTYADNATNQYGLYSGAAVSVISLPVALSYGVAVAVLPLISKNRGKAGNKAFLAFKYTMFIAAPAAIYCYFFGGRVASLLFRGIDAAEKVFVGRLIKISSVTVFLLSVLQTGSAVLIGKGKVKRSALNLGIACLLELILGFVLLKYAKIGVLALAFSAILCNLVAGSLNLYYSIKDEELKRERVKDLSIFTVKLAAISFVSVYVSYMFVRRAGAGYSAVFGLLIAVAIFISSSAFFNLFKREELERLFSGRKHGGDGSGNGEQQGGPDGGSD